MLDYQRFLDLKNEITNMQDFYLFEMKTKFKSLEKGLVIIYIKNIEEIDNFKQEIVSKLTEKEFVFHRATKSEKLIEDVLMDVNYSNDKINCVFILVDERQIPNLETEKTNLIAPLVVYYEKESLSFVIKSRY